MKTNGESIHGTTASLFPKVSWDGRSTTRHNADGTTHLYLHLFSRPEDGKLTVNGLATRPEKAAIPGRTGDLAISGQPGAWTLQLPGGPLDPIATVVTLSFTGEPEIQAAAKGP